MDMKQWALHDIEIYSICFFQVLIITFFYYFIITSTTQSPVLQLWSCTFFQHVTVLFDLYTSFKFLESFAYCVPLSASLRAGFSQN